MRNSNSCCDAFGGGDQRAEVALGREVVGAVHEEDPASGQRRVAELGDVAPGTRDEERRVAREVAAVRVRAVEVLGAHP